MTKLAVFSADLVTFIEETLKGKLCFLCSVRKVTVLIKGIIQIILRKEEKQKKLFCKKVAKTKTLIEPNFLKTDN